MGIFSGLLGTKDTIVAAGDVVEKTGNAFDKLFTSDDERLSHAEIMERIKQRPVEMAHALNMSDTTGNWFNSGWRPGLGWVGVIGLAMFFIPQYAMAAIVWMKVAWMSTGPDLPAYPVSADGLWQLVTLLISGKVIRTAEKSNGTAH